MQSLRKAFVAYRDELDKVLGQKFGAKLVTVWPISPQVIFCKKPVASLADLKGVKIRSYSSSVSDLISSIGAVPVQIALQETVPALDAARLNAA